MINQTRIFLFIVMVLHTGCKKFLDEKPNPKQVVPSSIQDLQALLDDSQFMSYRNPRAAELSADDFYLLDDAWEELTGWDYNIYIWGKKGLFPSSVVGNDWSNAYYMVQVANQVLAMIDNMPGDKDERNNVKGQAFFFRANAFLQITATWAEAFDGNKAQQLGIPLRLTPDFNVQTSRANLKQTYEQIISDAAHAADLLPVSPKHVLRPSRPGAFALLARVYLSMRAYSSVGTYANLSLSLKDTLENYNLLDTSAGIAYPFAPKFNNVEIITTACMMSAPALHTTVAIIDSNLYKMYAENDLRKKVFFKSNENGTYGCRATSLFCGLTTGEAYLMRAEAYARTGDIVLAMADLNKLIKSRTLTDTFVPLIANNRDHAIRLILDERRKELVMRGLRWMDIKRLNMEGRDIKLKRIVKGEPYILLPNDPRYALQIPEEVISMSGIEQNP